MHQFNWLRSCSSIRFKPTSPSCPRDCSALTVIVRATGSPFAIKAFRSSRFAVFSRMIARRASLKASMCARVRSTTARSPVSTRWPPMVIGVRLITAYAFSRTLTGCGRTFGSWAISVTRRAKDSRSVSRVSADVATIGAPCGAQRRHGHLPSSISTINLCTSASASVSLSHCPFGRPISLLS